MTNGMRGNVPVSYVLPVREASCSGVIAALDSQRGVYDFFEVWLDYLEDFQLGFASDLARSYGEQLIFVLRQEAGANQRILRENLLPLLEVARECNVMVDLDIDSQLPLICELKEQLESPCLILSCHDFEKTPHRELLDQKVEQALSLGADIVKIACFCHSPRDALRLLELGLDLGDRGVRSVVLGMGVHGLVTRVFGTLWTNEFIYAPFSLSKTTAQGQLCFEDLASIFEGLKRCGE